MDADVAAVFDCRGELSEEQTARMLPARTREWSLWPSRSEGFGLPDRQRLTRASQWATQVLERYQAIADGQP